MEPGKTRAKKKRPALRLRRKQRAPLRKVRERAGRRQAACGQAACSRANLQQRGLFGFRLLRWPWVGQVRGSDRAARGASKQVLVGSWLVPTAEVRPKSRPPETIRASNRGNVGSKGGRAS